MASSIGIALIGAGTMGRHHARVIRESARAHLVVVIDSDAERAKQLASEAGCAADTDLAGAMAADAAILATPTESHARLAVPLLEAGRPVFIEKPIATVLSDVRRILETAGGKGVPVTCGFVERFNPVVESARELISEPPLHFVAMRHSPETPRITTSVVFDLLIHDVDLAFLLSGWDRVQDVQSSAWSSPEGGPREIADCTLRFAGQMIATLSASRRSQRKIRTISIATESALIELDLLRSDLSVYRHVRHEQLESGTTYRAETVVDIPFVRHAGEPLSLQLEHFLDLIDGRSDADAERRSLLPAHEVAAMIEGSSS